MVKIQIVGFLTPGLKWSASGENLSLHISSALNKAYRNTDMLTRQQIASQSVPLVLAYITYRFSRDDVQKACFKKT